MNNDKDKNNDKNAQRINKERIEKAASIRNNLINKFVKNGKYKLVEIL